MKGLKIRDIADAIADRRLYRARFFLQAAPLLAFGFVVWFYAIFLVNRLMLLVYVPTFFLMILISGLLSKNYGKEYPSIGYYRGLLLLVISALASPLPFLMLENSLYGILRFIILLIISYVALWTAIVEVIIAGQRVSLRESMPLKNGFFAKQKEIWKEELQGFPNLEEVVNSLDDGKFVTSLFDRGSFNLAVLWSCNIMEKIIDLVVEEIVSRFPEKKALFRKDDGERLGYPRQLENLGFRLEEDDDEGLKLEILWHRLRNDVAHHNYRPSFHETYGTLITLVSFVEKMPEILQIWEREIRETKT